MRSEEDDAVAVEETKQRATLISWITDHIARVIEEVRALLKPDDE